MVACKHCSTPNSLDSAFCRRCGTSLPDAEIVVARKANEELVAEGVKLFQDGKTEEALAIAESASAADPISVTALALKGMAHERNGHVAEALECYERIVELHPDSTLDKIKLNQLRNTLAGHSAPAEPPNRKLAIIGAVGACAVVIGIGGLISMLRPTTQVVASNPQQKEESVPLVEKFSDPNPNQVQSQPQNANPGQANPQTNPNQAAQGNQAPPNNPQNQEPVRQNTGPTLPPVDRSSPLPNPSGNRDFRPLDPGAEPLTVDARSLTNPPVANPPVTAPPRGQDPDPGTARTTEDPKPNLVAEEPRPIMEMKVRTGQPGPRTGGGTDGNGLAAIVRTANAQFEVGNYSQAAANYERALRSGGDGGLLNQRLGQAYERQGKRADALVAYDRAAQSLEAAIASGRGDSDRLRNALESVKQARRALGGG